MGCFSNAVNGKGCCIVAALKNIKHENFCLHYSKTGNATESYKKAGYKAKTEAGINASASQLLKNPKVQARLAELAEEMASSKIADIAEIHEYLTAVMRGEEKEEVVVVEGLGDGISEARLIKKEANIKDRIKAGETLARMKGGFDNKLSVEVALPVFGGEEELED